MICSILEFSGDFLTLDSKFKKSYFENCKNLTILNLKFLI